MIKQHAELSASGASRWINCPPSLHIEKGFEETTSEYANEGSLAHEIAELKLRKYFSDMRPTEFTKAMNKLKKKELYNEEMQGYTDDYVDIIKEIANSFEHAPHCAIEKKVDFSTYVPGGFGTADCILMQGTTLWIIDFKYGKGVCVSAKDNPQMMLYALGALSEYSGIYNIENVCMSIMQPRLQNISKMEMRAAHLRMWGTKIAKPAAQKAMMGIGEQKVGEHCRFCKANALCAERAKEKLELAKYEFKKAELLSDEEIGDVLKRGMGIANWIRVVEDYVLNAILEGKEISGWKVVEGRSVRKFKDVDVAFNKLIEMGTEHDLLYERKPITLTAVEKLLGKKQFDESLSEDVEKAPGKPALAAENDKREPYKLTTAKKDFEEAI